MDKFQEEYIWIWSAIECLKKHAEEERESSNKKTRTKQLSYTKVNLLLWLIKNKKALPSTVIDITAMARIAIEMKNKKIETRPVSKMTVLNTLAPLKECGLFAKKNKAHEILMPSIKKEKKDKSLWSGKVIVGGVHYAIEHGNVFRWGPAKIKIMEWIWDHRNNLPKSLRKISKESGLIEDTDDFSLTTFRVVHMLADMGAIRKDEKTGEYTVIVDFEPETYLWEE